jgi:hydroxymethylpyrimidine pyrophosphatase-like HAD family hydrolase
MSERLREYLASQEFSAEQKESRELAEAYAGSTMFQMLDRQAARGEEQTALFTDIDNTFIRAGKEAASHELTALAETRDYPIVAVTGNDFAGVMKRIDNGELPHFQVIAGSVGTELWVLHEDESGKTYKKDEFYENMLAQSGYERLALAQRAHQLVDDLKQSHPDWQLDFQIPEREQEYLNNPDPNYQRFKISFHFFAGNEEISQVADTFKEAYPGQAIVTCEEIGHNQRLPEDAEVKKYCLDVLPLTKAGAVDYLTRIADIKKGIVAGDSGNDVNMLLESGTMNAVLVGGYKKEAGQAISREVKTKEGKRSFRSVETPEGKKAVYIEGQEGVLAAESILRAAKILNRAEKIKEIRNRKP